MVRWAFRDFDVPIALNTYRLPMSPFERLEWTHSEVADEVKVLPVTSVTNHLVKVSVPGGGQQTFL